MIWLEEVGCLYRNNYFGSEKPLYGIYYLYCSIFLCSVLSPSSDWIDYNFDLPELTYQRLRAASVASGIFLSLGNTGAATHRLWSTLASTTGMPPTHHTPRIRTKKDEDSLQKLIQLRHPDPSLTASLTLKDPSLQVRGSWLKLNIKNQPRALARFSFTTFIWNSECR